jgi:hypothetical protein
MVELGHFMVVEVEGLYKQKVKVQPELAVAVRQVSLLWSCTHENLCSHF